MHVYIHNQNLQQTIFNKKMLTSLPPTDHPSYRDMWRKIPSFLPLFVDMVLIMGLKARLH